MTTKTPIKISTRSIATEAPVSTNFQAVVVGAGPAGVAVVGNLLEQKKFPILWVDRNFHGGRLDAAYRRVPSNTKVKRFVSYADATKAFRDITSDAKKPNAYSTLLDLNQEDTCTIAEAADLIIMLTEGLNESKGVIKQQGVVGNAVRSENGNWSVNLRSQDASNFSAEKTVNSNLLVLCTGSSPIEGPLPNSLGDIRTRDLDTALDPPALAKSLSIQKEVTVGVIGASHSAILVLLNLYNLASTTHPLLKIKWFTRHPLRYAEERDGWIKRDNTGLKGTVATWARENLEPETLPSSPVSKFLTKIQSAKDDEIRAYEEHLANCTYVVQAIGFKANPIPTLYDAEKRLHVKPDNVTGSFVTEEDGKKVPGLYGAGIAFPERVTDPEGDVEHAVGLFKFTNYLGRVVKHWT
ncbi:pyridine nucleotide-disulfide oxidoreductase-domain-containing protein [Bisporella sp. PMI_857]|nr:pyridine nucleotide-disulfide oxidoreductase-domain-containing protein [Bisporella sp. PMI_857]